MEEIFIGLPSKALYYEIFSVSDFCLLLHREDTYIRMNQTMPGPDTTSHPSMQSRCLRLEVPCHCVPLSSLPNEL